MRTALFLLAGFLLLAAGFILAKLFSENYLGAERERPSDPLPDGYGKAFDAIERGPNNELMVAEMNGRVVGMLQLK
jgi:hypothetical protein